MKIWLINKNHSKIINEKKNLFIIINKNKFILFEIITLKILILEKCI